MWGEVRASWRPLLALLVGYTGLGTAMVWGMHVWSPGAAPPFLAGVLVGGLPVFGQGLLTAWGFSPRSMGADAEQWTAQELRKLDERAWTVVHDVPLSRANVDHVAIGPGRIYAIETKWTGTEAHPAVVKRWARQAAGLAEELRREMATRDVNREVVPLLVVWGVRARRQLGDVPTKIGPTRVVVGRASDVWLDRMRGAADQFVIDHPAVTAVQAIMREAEPVDGVAAVTPGSRGA